jgi:hypothetical protein
MVNPLKIEDMLDRETNFQSLKERILLLLEENELKEYVEVVVVALMEMQCQRRLCYCLIMPEKTS